MNTHPLHEEHNGAGCPVLQAQPGALNGYVCFSVRTILPATLSTMLQGPHCQSSAAHLEDICTLSAPPEARPPCPPLAGGAWWGKTAQRVWEGLPITMSSRKGKKYPQFTKRKVRQLEDSCTNHRSRWEGDPGSSLKAVTHG